MQMQLIKLDKLDDLEKNLENVSDAVSRGGGHSHIGSY